MSAFLASLPPAPPADAAPATTTATDTFLSDVHKREAATAEEAATTALARDGDVEAAAAHELARERAMIHWRGSLTRSVFRGWAMLTRLEAAAARRSQSGVAPLAIEIEVHRLVLRESQRQTLRATSTTLWVEAHPIVTSRRIASEPKSLPSRAPAATPTTKRLAGSAADAPPTELPVTLHEVLEIAPGGAQAAALVAALASTDPTAASILTLMGSASGAKGAAAAPRAR